MNLQPPVRPTCWRRHTKILTDVNEEFLGNNLKQEAFNVKRYLQTVGQIDSNIDEQTLRNHVIKIRATVVHGEQRGGHLGKESLISVLKRPEKFGRNNIKSSKC